MGCCFSKDKATIGVETQELPKMSNSSNGSKKISQPTNRDMSNGQVVYDNDIEMTNDEEMPGSPPEQSNKSGRISDEILEGMDDTDISELPNMIIVTNVNVEVFDVQETKKEFEASFIRFDSSAKFQYLRSFQRVRVVFTSAHEAIEAKFHLHNRELCGTTIKCFFVRPASTTEMSYLTVPAVEKQFLISPPSSPPVGWEQEREAHPAINYDLLSAITNMVPGETHELHPPTAVADIPSIVVHVSEDPEGYANRPGMLHTPRPPPTPRPHTPAVDDSQPGTSSASVSGSQP